MKCTLPSMTKYCDCIFYKDIIISGLKNQYRYATKQFYWLVIEFLIKLKRNTINLSSLINPNQ